MTCACISAVIVALAAASSTSPGTTLSGVISAAGLPVPNARITVFAPDLSEFVEARSATDGSYQIASIPAASTRFGVAARGYEYEESPFDPTLGDQVIDVSLLPETHLGSWDIVGDTLPELFDATDIGALLADGSVLYCHDTVDPIRFDPVTGEKSFPAGSVIEQGCMNGSLLADGSLLMVGGQSPSDPGAFTNAVPWVKSFALATDDWTGESPLQHVAGRWYPGMARLSDGSLIAMGGGQAPNASRTATCERLNLESMTWSYTGSMLNPSEFTPSALLYTGEVLATWSPPQLFSPATGLWRVTGDFTQPNRLWPGHSDHSIVVLDDGIVLAIGVVAGPDDNTNMVEVYDPQVEQWSTASNPDLIRMQTEVVQLPDGRILVAGGETETSNPPVDDVLGIVRWCDLLDPSSDSWRRVADMNWHREYHAVSLLVPDGRVLTTGGTRIKFQVGPTSADIEAFSPPYLYRGVRPQVDSISSLEPRRGESITLNISPATQITEVVLLGVQSTTHWVDGGIPRRIVLPVQQTGNQVTCSLPIDVNVAMLGHYIVFAMVDDIPSVGKIIRVRSMLGDLDGDGIVSVIDLLQLLATWGPCPSPCQADLNDDGVVNVIDLLSLLAAWS